MPDPIDCRNGLAALPAVLLDHLRQADEVLVLTGAGVSAESGIATFREALTGLWARFDPAQLATAEAFIEDPVRVWSWYEGRRAQVLAAQPNPAHRALAQWGDRHGRLHLVTQNVDDLHERAGSRAVIHLHGSLHAPRCFECARPLTAPALPEAAKQLVAPPRCPACGGLARPGVVWFGESLPEEALASAGPWPSAATSAWWSAPPAWCSRRPVCQGWRASRAPRWSASIRSRRWTSAMTGNCWARPG